jgi:hypothetical protein
LYLEYAAIAKSRKTGKPIAIESAAGYASMLTQHWSREMGFSVVGVDAQRYPAILRALRRTAKTTVRRGRRGLRAEHLKRAWKTSPSLRANTREAVTRLAAVSVAWQALCRAGEIAPGLAWDPRTSCTRADLQRRGRGRRAYYVLWLAPLKKKCVEKIPIIFARGKGGASDTFDMLRRLEKYAPVADSERASTPLFGWRGGAMGRAEFVDAVRDVACKAGQEWRKFHGHSARIGGATDLADVNASPLWVQGKGRWAGDISRIYTRLTRKAQIAASRAMMSGKKGRDLEEIFPNYVQPAM